MYSADIKGARGDYAGVTSYTNVSEDVYLDIFPTGPGQRNFVVFTPKQARKLARKLVTAADKAEVFVR